jgi:hypothetical protein
MSVSPGVVSAAAKRLETAAAEYEAAREELLLLLGAGPAVQLTAPHGFTAKKERKKPGRKPAEPTLAVVPAPEKTARATAKPEERTNNGADRVLGALEDGPLFFGDLMEKASLSKAGLYYQLAQLARAKRVRQDDDKKWRIAA